MRNPRIQSAVLWAAIPLVIGAAVTISYAGPPLPDGPHPDAGARYDLGPGARGRELKDGADLSDLDLRGMTLYGSANRYYSHVNFDRANLCGAHLEGEDNLSTKFRNCTFRSALMRRIQAEWVIDRSCDMTDADICGSHIVLYADQLRSTWSYKNQDLSYVNGYLLDIDPGLSFAGFNLQGTAFIINNEQDRERFAEVDFTDAEIAGARLCLTAKQLQSTRNYKRQDLGDITLTGDFRRVLFRGFNLRNTTFRYCNLAGCDFTDAEIWGMTVVDPVPYGGSMAEDHESAFTKEQIYVTKNYRRGDLDGVQFFGCDFRNADFSNQTLGYFSGCDLEGADFTNADHITGPNDERTDFQSFWPRIGFSGCNLSPEQFYSMRVYASKRFQPGCRMSGLDLGGWDFSDFDLRHVSFSSSMVENARFENARGGDLKHAKGLTVSQVKSMWNFKHDKMDLNSEFSLPREIVDELAEEESREPLDD